MPGREQQAVLDAVRALPREAYVEAPGGWPSEISTALIDAIYSIRQKYDSPTKGKGVLGRVKAFRGAHPQVVDDLEALSRLGEEKIRDIMGNTVTAGRHKSVAVVEAAGAFMAVGVRHAGNLEAVGYETAKNAYTGVRGLGWVTFEYFLMLLGEPGIKADTMSTRFVNTVLAAQGLPAVDSKTAHKILVEIHPQVEAARDLDLTDFDHSIWRHQRSR